MTADAGTVTGTQDRDYDLIWFVEACLANALRLDTYIADTDRAGDSEAADLFRRGQEASRKGAHEAKALLKHRLNGA